MVPRKTAAQATTSSRLLASSMLSRELNENVAGALPCASRGARQAYRKSEPPMTTTRKLRMNTPRAGSVAKACTEVMTPERTMKVPTRLRLKAAMASSSVQLRKVPRSSVTIRECISAVPTSQGMKEAFSTGSQNHQPPQPSS